MNYILEINAFYDWLQTNQLSKSAIALWHALMHINNKANWSDRFTVATSILEYNTGFKKSEIFKGRNELAQKGRIKWFTRGGNLSAEYQIISFCVHNTDANGNANGNANGTQTVTQMVTINKLNKTKQKNRVSVSPDGESTKPKVKSFKSLTEEEFYESLKPYVEIYGKQMVRNFFDHWTEKSPSGIMKFQLNKTWETSRRLKTWKNNEAKFSNTPYQPTITTSKPKRNEL